jgi:carboxypeptidase D
MCSSPCTLQLIVYVIIVMILRRSSAFGVLLLLLIQISVGFAVGKDVHRNKIKSSHREFDTNRKILQKNDTVQNVLKNYLENMPMQDHLKEFVTRCGSISRLKSIGKSTKGFNIWALEISDKPGRGEPEPHVKLVGNLHGDEPTGRALTMALAEWLCKNYETDADAKRIVNDVHLWLVPSMNPDGFAARKRENINDKDLNRNFPDRFTDPSMEPTGEEEAETAVMMKWSLTQHFVASLAFHEGAVVANYPWDGTADKTTKYEACPDDDTFKYLASTYAKAHANMSSADNKEFPNAGGITNGAAWYPIYGSMQDWNYLRAGCMEVTLEVSESKWPSESVLPQLFKDNLPAMLAYIKAAALGG